MQIRYDVQNDNEKTAIIIVSFPYPYNFQPNLLIVEKAKLTNRFILETLSDEQLKNTKEVIEDILKNGRISSNGKNSTKLQKF